MRVTCTYCRRTASYETRHLLERNLRELKNAIEAHSSLPHGFCVCPERNADKPEAEHVGECRELRLALRRVDEIL